MGRIAGIKKERVTISISHGNLKRINDAIDKNQFSNVSEAINEAITSFFENRNKAPMPPSDDAFNAWALTENGKKSLKDLIREVMNE
jgi:Arc/MetJ-type ribon-helix-helix transcriptional regulator